MISQHISNNQLRMIDLKRGLNYIQVPYVYGSEMKIPVEHGGPVYLLNPYTAAEQSANVKVYIDGGDKYPVYHKGDNTEAFLGQLKTYFEKYSSGTKGYHNVTELDMDYSLATFTLTRCYEAFLEQGFEVDEVVRKWDSFMEYLFEFMGLTKSQYQDMRLHLKTNQPYALAYATTELVCIQDDNWATAFMEGTYGWGFPHEVGHGLDNPQIAHGEVTNNMWSTKYVLDNKQFHSVCVEKSESDLRTLSHDVNYQSPYIWNDENTNTQALSMYWDLEVYHNGYWAELHKMLRNHSCGNAQADAYISNFTTQGQDKKERLALYTSAVLGIDMTYYFKRYGFLKETSQEYNNAINALSLRKDQPKLWYYEPYSYLDSRSTNVGKGAVINVGFYDRSKNRFSIEMAESLMDAHLGFEIVRDGQTVGFTWQNVYYDATASSNQNYTYTINAYDRSLKVYASCSFNTGSFGSNQVARVGANGYSSLKAAVDAAANGDTVTLLNNIYLDENININKSLTFTTADSTKTIGIYYNCAGMNMFNITNGAQVTFAPSGSGQHSLVFRTLPSKYSVSLFKLSGGSKVTFRKGVTFYNVYSGYNGSLASLEGSEIVFDGCLIEHCRTKKDGLIYLNNGSTMRSTGGTVFRYNVADGTGSVVCANAYNDRVYLDNTEIYSNSALMYYMGATICMNNGLVSVDSNTSIHDNCSDLYSENSAVYLSADADAVFSGSLRITDKVNTPKPVKVETGVSGTLTLRAQNDVAAEGFQIATSDSSAVMSGLRYANKLYDLSYNAGKIVLAKTSVLKNESFLSDTEIMLGSSVTIYGKATGGTGSHEFAYYYKNSTESSWTRIKDYSTTSSVQFTPSAAGTYQVFVNVKDGTGTVVQKNFTVTVKSVLNNKSTLSATTIALGKTLTINGKASGGSGGYQYAYYYRKSGSTAWTTVKSYSTAVTASVKPTETGSYEVRVDVRNSEGQVGTKKLSFTVVTPLVNKSVLSADIISLGDSVKVTAAATGGSGGYQYAVYYRKTGSSGWTKKFDYCTTQTATIKPSSVGDYFALRKAP